MYVTILALTGGGDAPDLSEIKIELERRALPFTHGFSPWWFGATLVHRQPLCTRMLHQAGTNNRCSLSDSIFLQRWSTENGCIKYADGRIEGRENQTQSAWLITVQSQMHANINACRLPRVRLTTPAPFALHLDRHLFPVVFRELWSFGRKSELSPMQYFDRARRN